MNSFLVLIKATLINNLGLNAFSKNVTSVEEKKKMTRAAITMVIGVVAILYSLFMYSFLIADQLEAVGYLKLLPLFGVLVSVGAIIFTTIYKASGTLFSTKDYEILKSLPINRNVIFISKVFELLVLNWLFSALVMIPPTVIYFMRTPDTSFMIFVILLISVFFIPLIPVIISSLIAIVISAVAAKSRFKNLVTVVGGMLVLLLVIAGSYRLPDLLVALSENSSSIEETISKIYPPAVYLMNALVEINFIELIKFILSAIIPFALFILIFNRAFEKINMRLGENHQKANYKVTSLKTSGVIKTLLNGEIKRYVSTPIYVFNTLAGVVLLLVGAIAILFVDKEMINSYMMMVEGSENMIMLAAVGLIGFTVGLSATTSSAISLEGKNIWILKSLPIETKDIFMSKILLNLIITIPAVVVGSIILSIGLDLNLVNFFWVLSIGVVYAMLSATVGLLINLNYPKLDWTSPTVVVKQSASVLINMLFTFASLAIPFVIYTILNVSNILVFLSGVLTALVILLLIAINILNTKGKELFRKL